MSAPGTALRPAAWAVLLAFCSTAGANPTGGSVAAGSAQFQTSGNTLTVTNAPGTVINWQQFSIGAGEVTRFQQPSASSAVLNRVVGGDPSGILGTLSSNGRVFLVNPSGIVFGQGAVIDTAGFVASTLNVADRDFLDGRLRFAGGGGTLRNEGTIRAGGDIFLVGPQIENAGLIVSEAGSVVLAAGKSVTITGPDAQGVLFALQAPEDAALNLGAIEARNAVGLFAGTLGHSGDIRATGAGVDGAGRLILSAQGDAIVEGNATLSADNAAGRGGSVQILGERVGLLDHAKVSASGTAGGGEIVIGGDYQGRNSAVRNAKATYVGPDVVIRADAAPVPLSPSGGEGWGEGVVGNGGKLIVWSDKATRVYGTVSARGGAGGGDGGFIETSGAYLDVYGIRVDATAPAGRGGEWLLDPNNIVITNGAAYPGGTNIAGSPDFTTTADSAQIHQQTINDQLNAGTSVTISTGSAGANSEAGTISMWNGISKTAGGDATLTLNAHNSIYMATVVSAAGKLNMVLNPDSDGNGSGGVSLNNGATLDANGGTLSVTSGYLTVWGNLVSALIRNSTATAPSFTLGGGATLELQDATLTVSNTFDWGVGTLTGAGSTTVAAGGTLNIHGGGTLGTTLNNNGTANWTWTACGAYCLAVDGVFNNAGTIDITADGGLFDGTGTFNNSGTFRKSAGAGTAQISDPAFNNTGTLEVGSGTLDFANGSQLTISGGAVTVATGAQLSSASAITLAGGSLTGAGTVSANVNNTGGTVAPGSAIGTLTIGGNYTQGAGGALSVELGGTGAGQSDALTVTGNVTMDGTLNASLSGGYSPADGDAIAILTLGGAAAGTFATVNAPANFNVGYSLFAGEAARLQYVAPAGGGSEEPSGPVAKYFDNGAGSFDWGDPINWAGDSLPGASEEAFIDAGHAVTHGSGTDTVGALTIRSGNSLEVSGGSLTVSGATSLGGVLTVSGSGSARLGTWSGAGTLNLGGGTLSLDSGSSGFTGAFDWSGGTLAGSGSLGSGVTFDLAGSGARVLDGPTLGLSGATLAGGSLDVQSGTLNLSGATTVSTAAELIKSAGTVNVSGALDNAGTVTVSAGTLSLAGGGSHTGSFSAASGATLAFAGGTHNLGDGAQLSGAGAIQFTGGALNATGSGTGATIASGTTFSLSGQSLGGTGKLANRGTFNFDDSSFGGSLDNRGTLNVGSGTSTASGSAFDMNGGTLTLAAGATLTKSGGAFNWNGGTIAGSGTFATSGGAAFNLGGSGTRVLDGPTFNLASLTVPAGSLRLESGALNLSGPATVASGATLSLTGGTLRADAALTIDGTLFWGGGTLTGAGSTTVTDAGTLTISSHSGNFLQLSGHTLTNNSANATWSGGGTVYGSGDLYLGEGAVFNNAGTLILTNNSDLWGTGGTINNSGTLRRGDGVSMKIVGPTLNNLATGIIDVDVHERLDLVAGFNNAGTVNVAGVLKILDSNGTGSGRYVVGAGGRVYLSDRSTHHMDSGADISGAGLFWVGSGATLAVDAAIHAHNLELADGGTINGAGALTIDNGFTWSGGTMSGSGSITVAPGASFVLSGFPTLSARTLTNHSASGTASGSLDVNDGAVFNNPGTLVWSNDGHGRVATASGTGTVNNSGVFRISDAASLVRVSDNRGSRLTFNNQAGGLLDLDGGNLELNDSVAFANAGTVHLGNGAALTVNHVANGVLALGSGTLRLAGGVLRGAGTLNGSLDNTGGTVEPGTSVGALTVNGNYTQGAGGTLSVELAGTQQGVDHDLLRVTGTANLEGSLDITLVGGFLPAAGNTFDFLTYAGRGGDFARFDYAAGSAFQASPDAAFYRVGIPSPEAVTAATPSATQPANLMLAMADKKPSISRQDTPAEDKEERADQECRP